MCVRLSGLEEMSVSVGNVCVYLEGVTVWYEEPPPPRVCLVV